MNARSRRLAPALLAATLAAAGCGVGSADGWTEARYSLFSHLDEARIDAPIEYEPVQLRTVRVGGVERAALLTHAPCAVTYPKVGIPPGARLTLGYGLDDQVPAELRESVDVSFSVAAVKSSGETEVLWSADGSSVKGAWNDVTIDLRRLGGQTVDLVLSTDAGAYPWGDWAAWSRPVIRAAARVATRPSGDAPAYKFLRDLLAADPDAAVDAEPSCRWRTRIQPPEGAVIDLAGQVLRDTEKGSGLLGPVRVALRVDGEAIYERTISTQLSEITLGATVPLDAYAGREVDLEFEFCDVQSGNTLIWAKRLRLMLAREAPRLPEGSGPNLLVLMVDTLRADRLSLYGHTRPTSPSLDRFARRARVFERAVSQSSWTLPAVASVMTGQHPVDHGVIEGVPLPEQPATLAELLQQAGMTTFGISSNPIVGRLEGMHRGFDQFLQIPWIRSDEINALFLDWLAENRDRRWFAYLHSIDPHSPYDGPEPWGSRFTEGCTSGYLRPDGLAALSETINLRRRDDRFTDADIACISDHYDGEVLFWDEQFGRLIAALEGEGLLENTVVVVVSDHGEEFLEHGHFMHGYQLHDELVRVPLVIRAPGLEPGRESAPVETRALREALLALMQAPLAGSSGGPLLDPEARGEPQYTHTTEAWVVPDGYTVLASVGDDTYKYIYRPLDGREQLYGWPEDAGETNDLAAEHPELCERYRDLVTEWLSGAQPHTRQTRGVDEETQKKLRALGYIR